MKKITLLLLITVFFITHSIGQPTELTVNDNTFYPEDIVIANNIAYVSGLGDGTLRSFDLTQTNPTSQIFADAEAGYTQAWGVKSDGTILLSILNNADFSGGPSGPAKLVAYDIATKAKTGEWDLPAGAIGHTVSIVDGKYYVTDFGSPRIFEVDPVAGTINDSWFTSTDWDPTISGIGGTIYDNDGGFYISQGNKLWYLPINNGTPGILQEVTVNGLSAVDADGISWVDSQNTLYYATNDTGDPANVGTVYKLVFSDVTTATGSVIATGLDDASGLWYHEKDGKEYVYVLESQFGALFGINTFEPPFNIEVIKLNNVGVDLNLSLDVVNQLYDQWTTVDFVFTVTNEGDSTATNIDVDATFPNGLVYSTHSTTNSSYELFFNLWTIPTLAPGESAILNLQLFTLVGDQDITYFSQIVALDQADADSAPDNSNGVVTEDDEASVTIVPKSNGGTGTNSGNTDLELSITTDNSSYNIYDVVRYTVSITNNGSEAGTGIIVNAGLPNGLVYSNSSTSLGEYNAYFEEWKIDLLEVGQTVELELDLFILLETQGQAITNFVQIFVTNELDPDSSPGNNTSGIPAEDDEASVTIQVAALLTTLTTQVQSLKNHNNILTESAVTPQNGWTNNSTLVDEVSSENSLEETTNILVSPNPFKNTTNFEIQLTDGGEFQLQVFDISGKEVTRKTLGLNEGTNRIIYDGSHLSEGFYSYRLSNKLGFISGKMIVIK